MEDDHTVPPFPPFPSLLSRATHNASHIILRDHSSPTDQLQITSSQLLHSILAFRNKIRRYLSPETLQHLRTGSRDVFICILVPAGWEFVVSALAILALGAAPVPLSLNLLPAEAKYLIGVSKAVAMIYRPALAGKVIKMKAQFSHPSCSIPRNFAFIDTPALVTNIPITKNQCTINEGFQPRVERAGSLLFTSGTTGPPKGVVHTYAAINKYLERSHRRNRKDEIFLSRSPTIWATGFFTVLTTAMTGTCLEICSSVYTPRWFWERIRNGDVTIAPLTPQQHNGLASYFEEVIDKLPFAEREKYVRGVTSIRTMNNVGAPLTAHVQQWWTDLRGGKPLMNVYSSTELLLVCDTPKNPLEHNDKCPVGPAVPGVQIKLVDGEMLVKTPWMFSRYISEDPNALEATLDSEGFFKTGDLAEKYGDSCYVIHGRASVDSIRTFSGYKLQALEVEAALHGLPYVSTALVVGVEDQACHQRVAAVIGLRPHPSSITIDLSRLRKDLTRTALQWYKFPTAVYWLSPGQELPSTETGKISKVLAKKQFFGPGYAEQAQVEIRDLSLTEKEPGQGSDDGERLWQWTGIAD